MLGFFAVLLSQVLDGFSQLGVEREGYLCSMPTPTSCWVCRLHYYCIEPHLNLRSSHRVTRLCN